MKKYNRSKKIIASLSAASLACFCSGAVVFAKAASSTVTNHFATGIVDIDLKEYTRSDDKEEDYKDPENILPGQSISKIPRISNLGNDCYIRTRYTTETEMFSVDDIYGIGEDWVKAADGYWYYKNIVQTGESVDAFEGIGIPGEFEDQTIDRNIDLDVVVEAVQAKNFSPDFSADSPWGDVEIKECIKDDYDVSTMTDAQENGRLKVTYEGSTQHLVSDPKDFFQNFPTMMPGDSYRDTAKLKNSSSKDIDLYFKADTADSELAKNVHLKVTSKVGSNEKTVFDGTLNDTKDTKKQLLGTLKSGSEDDLEFEITVPSELDNEYAAELDKVNWTFSADPITDKKDRGTYSNGAKTGDDRIYGITLMVAGVALGISAMATKKREESETSEV